MPAPVYVPWCLCSVSALSRVLLSNKCRSEEDEHLHAVVPCNSRAIENLASFLDALIEAVDVIEFEGFVAGVIESMVEEAVGNVHAVRDMG
jgi:hypothetical protein